MKLLGVDPVTHKPIEKKQNDIDDQEEKGTNSHENKSEGREHCLEAKTVQFPETNFEEKSNPVELITSVDDQTHGLLKSYEMLCGNLGLGTWIHHETNTNTTTTSYSSSFSMEESNNNPSILESPSIHHHQAQQWVDSSSTAVDTFSSIHSWDVFSSYIPQLEKDLFLFDNGKLIYPPL